MLEGSYEFSDGLQYENPAKWNFCSHKDRRFYHEVLHGVSNPDILKHNSMFKDIPEGTYG